MEIYRQPTVIYIYICKFQIEILARSNVSIVIIIIIVTTIPAHQYLQRRQRLGMSTFYLLDCSDHLLPRTAFVSLLNVCESRRSTCDIRQNNLRPASAVGLLTFSFSAMATLRGDQQSDVVDLWHLIDHRISLRAVPLLPHPCPSPVDAIFYLLHGSSSDICPPWSEADKDDNSCW